MYSVISYVSYLAIWSSDKMALQMYVATKEFILDQVSKEDCMRARM